MGSLSRSAPHALSERGVDNGMTSRSPPPPPPPPLRCFRSGCLTWGTGSGGRLSLLLEGVGRKVSVERQSGTLSSRVKVYQSVKPIIL